VKTPAAGNAAVNSAPPPDGTSAGLGYTPNSGPFTRRPVDFCLSAKAAAFYSTVRHFTGCRASPGVVASRW
jgi:hypothetical protein